jgi:hypothetical protein
MRRWATGLLVVLAACGGGGSGPDPVLERIRTTTDCDELADLMGEHVFLNATGGTISPDQKEIFDVALARLKTLGCP